MYIVTHPGMAHRDEFMAIALLLGSPVGKDFSSVARREPTPEEMSDPNVWVVDIGMEDDPAKHNFDHHQYEPAKGICAMSLVSSQLGINAALKQAFGWFRLTELMDTQGPGGVAREVGCDPNTVLQLWSSPIEHFMLERFSNSAMISKFHEGLVDEFLQLRHIGTMIWLYIDKLKERMSYLRGNVQVVGGAGLQGMYLPRDPDVRPSPFGLDIFRRENCPEAAFSITPDDRGDGYALYRYEDNPGLDFAKLAEDPWILFAHKGGFVAKTHEALELRQLTALVNDSAVLVVK
jgi:hypothetical protein